MSQLPASFIPPNSSRTFHAFGDLITILLDSEQTGGQFTMFLTETPTGGGPPPHYHQDEDEWFYPLAGNVEFLIDETWQPAPLNSAIFVPAGAIHAFRNIGDDPLQLLTHTAPAGIERFFERCALEFAKPGPPDMKQIVAISEEHGVHFA